MNAQNSITQDKIKDRIQSLQDNSFIRSIRSNTCFVVENIWYTSMKIHAPIAPAMGAFAYAQWNVSIIPRGFGSINR